MVPIQNLWQVLKSLSTMKPTIYSEGVDLKKFVNEHVYVGFL